MSVDPAGDVVFDESRIGSARRVAAMSPREPGRWHLGAMNDALFIIDRPPRPSNDHPWHDRPDGPDLVLRTHPLADGDAQAIVDAHNAAMERAAADAERRIGALEAAIKRADDVLACMWSYNEESRAGLGHLCAVQASDVLREALRAAPATAEQDTGKRNAGPVSEDEALATLASQVARLPAAEPSPGAGHVRLDPAGHPEWRVDDWHCSCGWWGNLGAEGFRQHVAEGRPPAQPLADDPRPDHRWNDPDGDGHNCADCPDVSQWRCDWFAHVWSINDVLPDDVREKLADDLREAARERRAGEASAASIPLAAAQPAPPPLDTRLCGVLSPSGRFGEMLGCGFEAGHQPTDHSWATLPTFTDGLTEAEALVMKNLWASADPMKLVDPARRAAPGEGSGT